MTPFHDQSVLCYKYGSKIIFREIIVFHFLTKKCRNRRLMLGNQKYTSFLDQLINYVSLIITIKLRLLHRGFRDFLVKKLKNYYCSESAGFLGYKMSTTLLVRKMVLLPYLWRKVLTHL